MKRIQTKTIAWLVVVCSLPGCSSSWNDPEYETIYITPESSEITLSHLFSELTPVQLETTNLSLIGSGNKCQLTATGLYVKSEKSLLVFNRNSTFIRKFDRNGKGPEEYHALTDFLVDENREEILILDGWQQKLLSYTLQGEFRQEYPLDFYAGMMTRYKEDLYLYSGNNTTPEDPYPIKRLSDYRVAGSFYRVDEDKKDYLHIITHRNFYPASEGILFFEAFNDTIYKISPDGVLPLYIISYEQGKKNVPRSFYEKDHEDIRAFFQQFNRMNYINSTYDLFEAGEKLFFTSYGSGKKCLNIYDRSTGKGSSYTSVADDMLCRYLPLAFNEDQSWFQPADNQEEIFFFMAADHLVENKDQITSGRLKEIAEDLREDDNPVLIIGKF
ncbi:MAG: 6-bladed beta-propeller [Bacteroides sp.]|nr:6-bladed beta-propeller [Bacteroides sp.]